jgi:hypothetical protein
MIATCKRLLQALNEWAPWSTRGRDEMIEMTLFFSPSDRRILRLKVTSFLSSAHFFDSKGKTFPIMAAKVGAAVCIADSGKPRDSILATVHLIAMIAS